MTDPDLPPPEPVRFQKLTLPSYQGTVPASDVWESSHTIPRGQVPPGLEMVYVQVLRVRLLGGAALSSVVRLTVPRSGTPR